jgi:hypothetical protein
LKKCFLFFKFVQLKKVFSPFKIFLYICVLCVFVLCALSFVSAWIGVCYVNWILFEVCLVDSTLPVYKMYYFWCSLFIEYALDHLVSVFSVVPFVLYSIYEVFVILYVYLVYLLHTRTYIVLCPLVPRYFYVRHA